MKTIVFCKATAKGVHSFYLKSDEGEFFLFNQNYRKGVHKYFSNGVFLDAARDYSKSNNDYSIVKTMNKLPAYIKYVEKEYEIDVFEQTKKKKINAKNCRSGMDFCA